MSRIPLNRIAERAGVSVPTASRVLRNSPNVSAKTRKLVLDAVSDLMPPPAHLLHLGLVVPDLLNPFFSRLAVEVESAAFKAGAEVLVASSDARADRELSILHWFRQCEVDGVLFISSGTGHSEALVQVVDDESMPPVQSLDRGLDGHDRVYADSSAGTLQAVDHLRANGHSRVGYLRGKEGTETAEERFDAFLAAMSTNRLDVKDAWVFQGDYDASSGRVCADHLMSLNSDDRPTAMLTANDLMAVAMMERLMSRGWRLPRDLSVIGFDGIEACEWIHPKLSTVAQPFDKLARAAVDLLLSRVNERARGRTAAAARVVKLQPEFVARKSVCNLMKPQRLRVVGADLASNL